LRVEVVAHTEEMGAVAEAVRELLDLRADPPAQFQLVALPVEHHPEAVQAAK
jgi:hypothetical protein